MANSWQILGDRETVSRQIERAACILKSLARSMPGRLGHLDYNEYMCNYQTLIVMLKLVVSAG
jgi:hypothetical protein